MIESLPTLTAATAEQLLSGAVIAPRNRWAVLKASGDGLRDYLQGQITQDMGRLSAEQAIHSCILTPQGKAASELYILEGLGDELILLTPAAHAEAIVARLRRFALGYRLRIGLVDTLAVCSVQGAGAAEIIADAGLDEPGEAWLGSSRAAEPERFALVMPQQPRGFWLISERAWSDRLHAAHTAISEDELIAMRIIRGLPEFGCEWDERIHPLNANLIEFDGVSFDKGCYVGQEVTSRMHWRGGIKKRLYRIALSAAPEQLPCPILTQSGNVGELRSAAIDHEQRCVGIALLPIETAESAAALTLENGATVELLEACHA